MGFFFVTRKEKVSERIGFVKNLCRQMNATYYYGIESVKNQFNVGNDDEKKDSNVIVGNAEGYDYCFVEYYHLKKGKNDHSYWNSFGSLRLKNDYPYFQLTKISSAKSDANFTIGIGIIFGFISLPLLINILSNLLSLLRGQGFYHLLFVLFQSIFLIIIGFISYLIIYSGIDTLKEINNQRKYGIRNPIFRKKYVILSSEDPYKISKIFNDEICDRIVKAIPEINYIQINNNCINASLSRDEKLAYSSCKRLLNTMLKQAHIFEKKDEFGYEDEKEEEDNDNGYEYDDYDNNFN